MALSWKNITVARTEEVFNGAPQLEHIMNTIDVQVILYPNPAKAPPQWDASPQAATTAIEWLFEWDASGVL